MDQKIKPSHFIGTRYHYVTTTCIMISSDFNLHCEIKLFKHSLIQIGFVAFTSKTTIPAPGLIAEVSTFICNYFDPLNIIHTIYLTPAKWKETPKQRSAIRYW